MRLFIALEFPDSIKKHLSDEINTLRAYSDNGSFTVADNLHLTLVFIGEVELSRVDIIKQEMKKACSELITSTVKINGFGKFTNRGELLYWRGMECPENILVIRSRLARELRNKGFAIEFREFVPHITMGRRCVMKKDFNENEFSAKLIDKKFEINSISLMKSERIDGKMVYTNIFSC